MNITSWRKRAERILDEKVDVLALQEVRLSRLAMKGAATFARRKGWSMAAGKESLQMC